jgi:hypothetical protein
LKNDVPAILPTVYQDHSMAEEKKKITRVENIVSMMTDLAAAKARKQFEETIQSFVAPDQKLENTCYAQAIAAALVIANQRTIHRPEKYPGFKRLRKDLVAEYGSNGAHADRVLNMYAPKFRFRVEKILYNQPIPSNATGICVVTISGKQWNHFRDFFQTNPKGVLETSNIGAFPSHESWDDLKCESMTKRRTKKRGSGYTSRKKHTSSSKKYCPECAPEHCGCNSHAVLLMGEDDDTYDSIKLWNSWGPDWGDNGAFRIRNASVLRLRTYILTPDISDEDRHEFFLTGMEEILRLAGRLPCKNSDNGAELVRSRL